MKQSINAILGISILVGVWGIIPLSKTQVTVDSPFAPLAEGWGDLKVAQIIQNGVITPLHATEGSDTPTPSETVTEADNSANNHVSNMINLRLLESYLQTGLELYTYGEMDMAETQFNQATDETLSALKPMLEEKRLSRPVEAALNRLQAKATDRVSDREMKKAYEETIDVLHAVESFIPESERRSPEFMGEVISTLISTAATQYEMALENEELTGILQYQNGRNILATVRNLLYREAGKIVEDNPENYREIATLVGKLSAAWPTTRLPSSKVYTEEEVTAMAQEIEAILVE